MSELCGCEGQRPPVVQTINPAVGDGWRWSEMVSAVIGLDPPMRMKLDEGVHKLR